MADYHCRIMNIQIEPGLRKAADNFPNGHKEARHAAALIGAEADAEIAALRVALGNLLYYMPVTAANRQVVRTARDLTTNPDS